MGKNISHDSLKEKIVVNVVSAGVLINGLLIITTTLIQQLIPHFHPALRPTQFSIDSSILVAITLIYFSNLLRRRKQTAWLVVLLVYALYIGISLSQIDARFDYFQHHIVSMRTLQEIILPSIIVIGLLIGRTAYTVKSDIKSFGSALRIILIIFLAAFFYGVAGFSLMEKGDFHQDFNITEAAHRTIDQLNLTTSNKLMPVSRRARLFEDSLNVVSVTVVGYALLSLFQPLKARFHDQESNRRQALKLLSSGHGDSEDFFKIWPHDKSYFFNEDKTAGLAFRVQRGMALVAGDPFGAVAQFKDLVMEFNEFCRINDWQPSFIQTLPHYNPLYKNQGFTLQKIGEEAVVSVDHFEKNVIRNKYFRNIVNKFEKNGYRVDVLSPPHSPELIKRLKSVSDDWLKLPGRSERGFMIGYFSESYLQMGNILVLRDTNGEIQAFLNQVRSFNHEEANYDMIRHSREAPGNSTDYVLANFIKHAKKEGFKQVNLGLAPLIGLGEDKDEKNIIDGAMRFLYSNGDKLYSFSGLYNFKRKYEPEWSDRFIAYKKGVNGFIRTVNAVNKAMRPHHSRSGH